MDAFETYASLPTATSPAAFVAEVVPNSGYRVGKNFLGHPVIFLGFETCSGARSTPRRLATVTYEPPKPIEVRTAAGVISTENLAVFECRSTDEPLVRYFFRLANSILDLETRRDESRFDTALDTVVTIFRALQRSARRSVQGVWAELATIHWSANAMSSLAAWHSSPRAIHDFSGGSDRLEVKSSVTGMREHQVRLEQLAHVSPGRTILASVLLEESDSGATVEDLINLISDRIREAPDAIRRLELVVAESLGRDWRDSAALRYALTSARESLRYFDADDVPRVALPLPPEVKEVHFVVDLTHVPTKGAAELARHSSFFAQVLP